MLDPDGVARSVGEGIVRELEFGGSMMAVTGLVGTLSLCNPVEAPSMDSPLPIRGLLRVLCPRLLEKN